MLHILLLRGSLADSYRVTAGGGLIAVSVKQAAAEVFMPVLGFSSMYLKKAEVPHD